MWNFVGEIAKDLFICFVNELISRHILSSYLLGCFRANCKNRDKQLTFFDRVRLRLFLLSFISLFASLTYHSTF
jgi:hypothetical protein